MKKNRSLETLFVALIFAAMSVLLALALMGCATNKPVFRESITVEDGRTNTVRELTITTRALWPATTDLAKQKASMSGKTWSVGTEGLREDGGGTNVVESLRELNKLLGR